jgi:hypothetical protein
MDITFTRADLHAVTRDLRATQESIANASAIAYGDDRIHDGLSESVRLLSNVRSRIEMLLGETDAPETWPTDVTQSARPLNTMADVNAAIDDVFAQHRSRHAGSTKSKRKVSTMTEQQAKTLAENLASTLHQLALVEARRAVEEYRSRTEPGVSPDEEGLKQASVQARRDVESVLTQTLLEITAMNGQRHRP